ncbi:MAG: PstS family phosphate ABC transporter substrate-binding protein [Candidatus Fibromonas sp.]|jgi:phosphate transport system substrate-binding protein|nr:PstS family phosphate ABC transporter substrate-binding protein [Candidatus Fibromonas sp.]
MKKILLTTILSVASILTAQTITGSDTVLPLSQQEAESYMKAHKNAKVTVTGGGSGVGISALIDGTTEIAQSSRKIKFDEKKKVQDKGSKVIEVIIAYDALAVVVNPKNKVSNLTREQLEGIFTGKITNWKEVGGDDLKIVAYSRETSSGTYEFFKEEVLKKKDYMAGIQSMPATGTIVQSVSQTPGAIGYIGLAYLDKKVKAISVSYDEGKTFVPPSVKTAKDETYPIVRPLIYYYTDKSESAVKPFIDYVLSAAGQKIVSDIGFITIK